MRKTSFLPLLIWWCAFFAVLGWKPDFAYNAQRYFEWLLLGSLLIVGAILPVQLVLQRAQWISLLVLAGLSFWVVWSAPEGWLALRYLLVYVALILAALAVAKVRAQVTPLVFDRAALLGVVCFCFGASLIALEGLFVSISIGEVSHLVIFAAFVNVRMLADMQFATLFLLPAAWLLSDSRRLRMWISITAMLWWAWLWFSGTRAALVVIPWVLLVVCLCAGKSSLPWFKRLLCQLLSGLLLFLSVRVWLYGLQLHADAAMQLVRPGVGSSGRIDHWLEAWQHFWLHPWLGNGPGAYSCFTRAGESTPHNIFFMLLSEWGGPATLIAGLVAFWAFVIMVKHLRGRANINPMALSLFASVVAVVSAAQLQGVFIAPIGQLLVVLVLGWSWHLFAQEAFARLPLVASLSVSKLRLMRWPLVFVILSVWLVMARADITLQKSLLVLPNGTINLNYAPRYWADGHDHCLARRYR